MGKKLALVVGLVGALVASPAVGHTADGGAQWTIPLCPKTATASPWTAEVGWGSRAVGKLGFGVKNLLLGWTELFTEPKQASAEGRNVLGGLGKGLVNGLMDTIGGAVHIVTFPITGLDAALPQGGVEFFS